MTAPVFRQVPMPAATARVHLDPYWKGDSKLSFRAAAKKKLGHRFTDNNFQACADGEIAMHWSTPRQNGYLFIWTGKFHPVTRLEIRRKLSVKEANQHLIHWTVGEAKHLRRTLRPGLSYESRVRPYSFREMFRLSAQYDTVMCAELKSPEFASEPARAQRMVDIIRAERQTAYFMALVNMEGCRRKCANVEKAGGQFAVLTHDFPRPKDWNLWNPKPTRLWPPRKDWHL